jgi:hypothetical protein
VSTNPASNFSLEIFRTGYFGGAGGRRVMQSDSLPGKTQADPPIGENRLRECQWEASVESTIPNDWLSGVYLGKLLSGNAVWNAVPLLPSSDGRPHRIIRRDGWFLPEQLCKQLQKQYGFQFKQPSWPDAAQLMGGRMAGVGGGDWTCTKPEHWL